MGWFQGVLFHNPILKEGTARIRTAEEVTMRCKLILDQPDIVSLVDKSSSPTAAYDMVMDATGNDETAKVARWLGILRRDYPIVMPKSPATPSATFRGTR